MDRRTKVLWGLASVLPIIGLIAALILKRLVIPGAEAEADVVPGMENTVAREAAAATAALLAVRTVSVLVIIVMMVLTFLHVLNKPDVETRDKAIWVVALLVPWVSLPVYWYLHVWSEPLLEPEPDRWT